jgi:hypothetical protein
MKMTPDDRMRLYALGAPLHWQPSEHGKDALIANAYEGEYLIPPSAALFALHFRSDIVGKWMRLAEGRTLEEVKHIAELEAARNDARRKKSFPKEWEEARRREKR